MNMSTPLISSHHGHCAFGQVRFPKKLLNLNPKPIFSS